MSEQPTPMMTTRETRTAYQTHAVPRTETDWPPPPQPNIDHITTEDDEPVDNIFSEKQQRLLTRALYSSTESLPITKPFLALANVGLFYGLYQPPIVPDVLLSLGVKVAEDWYAKEHRSYFVWEFGKLPELTMEIVSNKKGGEMSSKMTRYAEIGIPYYVVYDPQGYLNKEPLQAYSLNLQTQSYEPLPDAWFSRIGLGLTLWQGEFETVSDHWLRWCDHEGQLILTGEEQARQVRLKMEDERQAKEMAQTQADHERLRAERYLAKLRELGVSLDE